MLSGEIPANYLNRYHAEYDVICAFCDKHTPHRKGFTAQMKDGRIALCGRDCAIKYFGKSAADNFEAALEQQIRKESTRKILQQTLNGVPQCLANITPDLVAVEQTYLDATHYLGAFFKDSGLLSTALNNGNYEHKETRKWYDEKQDRYGVVQRVPVFEELIAYRIERVEVLRTRANAQSSFQRAKIDLTILADASSQQDLSDELVERILTKRADIMGVSETLCMRLSPCEFGGSFVEPFWV